jgi:hypothetical protein
MKTIKETDAQLLTSVLHVQVERLYRDKAQGLLSTSTATHNYDDVRVM